MVMAALSSPEGGGGGGAKSSLMVRKKSVSVGYWQMDEILFIRS